MASPQRSDVHVDRPLSNLAITLGSPAYKGMVFFPEYMVQNETDKYYVYKDREGLRRVNTKRAIGDESRTFDFKPSTESYTCEEFSLHKLVPDRILNNADSATRVVANSLRLIRQYLDGDLEHDIKEIVTNTGGLTSAAPAVKWNASSGTIVIEANIDVGKQAIRDNSGKIANNILIEGNVKDVVKKNSTVRDLIRYTIQGSSGQQLLVSGELPPVLWGMKVTVAEAIEDTAIRGQTASISQIWSEHVILAFIDPNPTIDSATLGLNFRVRGGGRGAPTVKRWREEKRNGTIHEMSIIQVPKVVASQCGYNLYDVLD